MGYFQPATPDLYQPSTITNNWFRLPYEAMAQTINAAGTAYNNNLETMSNIESKIAEMKKLKTFDELQPEIESAIGGYSDKINQFTSTLVNNPNLYLSAGPQLKRLGLEISKDISSGNIGNYVNAYNNYQAAYQKDINDSKKLPQDVNAIYAVNKKNIIEGLRNGTSPSSLMAPDNPDIQGNIAKWAKEFKESKITNPDGTSVEQNSKPDFVKSMLYKARTNPEFQNYAKIMMEADPNRFGPQIVLDTNGKPKVNPITGKPIYRGYLKNGQIGEVDNSYDAINGFDKMLQDAVDNEWLIHSGAKIDNKADKIPSTTGGSNTTGLTITGSNTLTNSLNTSKTPEPFVNWTKKDTVELERLNKEAKNGATQSIREQASRDAHDMINNYNNRAEIHNHADELAKADLVTKGKTYTDSKGNSFIGQRVLDYFKQKVSNAKYPNAKNNYNWNPEILEHAKTEYEWVKKLNEDYAQLYKKHYEDLITSQRSTTRAIGTTGVMQKEIANIIETEKGSVEIFDEKGNKLANNATTILDNIENNKYLDKYSFETIKPTDTGSGLEVRVLDKEAHKTYNIKVNSPDAVRAIQQHILSDKNVSKDIESYTTAMGDTQRMKVYNTISQAIVPNGISDFGPLTQADYGNVIVKFRKAKNGSIIAKFIDKKNPSHFVLDEFNSSSANGDIVQRLMDINHVGVSSIKQSNSNLKDPEKTSIFSR